MNLGVVTQLKSSPSILFEEIKDYRNESAIKYYMRCYNLDRQTAEHHFIEMLKFLCIIKFNPGVTPSDQIDEVWHAMIIQTKAYHDLCNNKMGKFIHHSTTDAPRQGAYVNVLEVYNREFGEPPNVWLAQKLKHANISGHPVTLEDCEPCKVVGWCSFCSDD